MIPSALELKFNFLSVAQGTDFPLGCWQQVRNLHSKLNCFENSPGAQKQERLTHMHRQQETVPCPIPAHAGLLQHHDSRTCHIHRDCKRCSSLGPTQHAGHKAHLLPSLVTKESPSSRPLELLSQNPSHILESCISWSRFTCCVIALYKGLRNETHQ